MRIFVEPNDVLMFRDGRPFAGGEDHFARCVFPPYPSTFYGAIRSHILSVRWPEFKRFRDSRDIPEDLRKEIGTPETTGEMMISRFSIAERTHNGRVGLLYPMPRDIVQDKDTKDVFKISPQDLNTSDIMSNIPHGLNYAWLYREEVIETINGYLSTGEMERYLSGGIPSSWKKADEIYEKEPRTGILKDRARRSVQTGGLYSVEYLRLNNGIGFAIEVLNTDLLPSSGVMRLGGDHRSAFYKTTTWDDIRTDPIRQVIEQNRRFKLLLTTPAIFKQGWLPSWMDRATLEGTIDTLRVKLLGACTGNSVGVGGFDLVKGMPKVMKRAVPAGSVYYFEVIEGDTETIFDRFWLKSISDERTEEGFGITLIGGW